MLTRGLAWRAVLALGVAGLVVWGTTEWLARPWSVVGSSMEPALFPGDRVLVDLRARVDVGDVVLIAGPADRPAWLVKRVQPRPIDGPARPHLWPDVPTPTDRWLWVLGDNRSASEDSRRFGAVPPERVLGRVAFRYGPLSRWGSIPRGAVPAPPGR